MPCKLVVPHWDGTLTRHMWHERWDLSFLCLNKCHMSEATTCEGLTRSTSHYTFFEILNRGNHLFGGPDYGLIIHGCTTSDNWPLLCCHSLTTVSENQIMFVIIADHLMRISLHIHSLHLSYLHPFGVTFASLVENYKGNVSLIQCQTVVPMPHMIPRGCTLPTLVFFWLCHQKVDISAIEFNVDIQIGFRMSCNNFGETLLLHLVLLIRVCKISENVQKYWRREPRVGTEGSIGVLPNVEHEWAFS